MFGWVRTMDGSYLPVITMLDLDNEVTEERFMAETAIVSTPTGYFSVPAQYMGLLV